MKTILDVFVAVLGAGGIGAYLYFNAERILDSIIRFQQRVHLGWYRKADPNMRCPACGQKSGTIFYNPELQRLMHTCAVCNASWPHPAKIEWPQNTRLPVNAWDVVGRTMKENQDQIVSVREVFERANTPLKAKEEKNVS